MPPPDNGRELTREEHIALIVATAPPLSSQQRAKLAALLHGRDAAGGTEPSRPKAAAA